MKLKKTIVGVLASLSLGLMAIALMPKGYIKKANAETYTLVTDLSMLSNGDQVVLKTKSGSGVTGYNGTSDANVSTNENNWVKYVVGDLSSTGFTLYDSSANKYIASPGGNEFKYDATTGGVCSVYSTGSYEGAICCNNRALMANGTKYRFYQYSHLSDYTVYYTFKIGSAKTVSSITVKTPAKSKYFEGEKYDPTGLVITVTYSNEDTEDVAYNNETAELFSFEPSKALTALNNSVVITYGGKSCEQSISVSEVTITKIEVTHYPKKMVYVVGEDFDPTEMEVTVTHSEGTIDVTDECTYTPETFSNDHIGDAIPVTISYGEVHTSIYVTVNAAPSVATYKLVESSSELKAGDTVLFAQRGSGTHVLGPYYKNQSGTTTYYQAASGEANKSSDGKKIMGLPEGAIEFTVENGTSTGSFSFVYDTNKYICAKSNSDNIMGYETTKSANSSWNLTITSSETSIESAGSYSKKYLLCNTGSLYRFSCYGATTSAIEQIGIYKYTSGAENITLNVESDEGPTGKEFDLIATPTVGFEPTYTWSVINSSAEGVLSLSDTLGSKITVTYGVEGTATVKCRATQDDIIRDATCTITVKNYSHDALEPGSYKIGNAARSTVLNNSNVRKTVSVNAQDFSENTNLFTISEAYGWDDAYYITVDSSYLNRETSTSFYLAKNSTEHIWTIKKDSVNTSLFNIYYTYDEGTPSNNVGLYYSNNSGSELFGVSSNPTSYNYKELSLTPVENVSTVELVDNTPDKVEYDESETFDPAGLQIVAHYPSFDVDITDSQAWEWDSLVGGQNYVQGHINIKGTNYDVTVNGLTVTKYVVTSLNVDASDAKTQYFAGQSVSKSGLSVTAISHDQTNQREDKEDILEEDDYTVSPSTVQSNTDHITVSYGGQSDQYGITVKTTKYEFANSVTNGDRIIFVCEGNEEGVELANTSLNTFGHVDYSYKPCGEDDGADVFEVVKGSETNSKAFRNVATGKYIALKDNSYQYLDDVNSLSSWTIDLVNGYDGDYHLVENCSLSSKFIKYNTDSGTFKPTGSEFIQIYKDGTLVKPQSISVDSSSTHPTEFEIGDTFSYAGLAIYVNYGGGAHDVITSGFNVETPDMNTSGTKKVTVTYHGVETTYNITVNPSVGPKTLVGITAEGMKTVFGVGDYFSFGGTVYALYSDATKTPLANNQYTITGQPDANVPFSEVDAGKTKIITIKLNEDNTKQFQYEIHINESFVKLDHISVSGQRTTFTVGDTFEFGGIVTAHYDDESTLNVTTGATFSGYNMNTTGTQTVTVSYTEGNKTKTTTYTITVNGSNPGGNSGDTSDSGSSEHGGDSKKNNNLAWIIPVAVVGGIAVIGGIGVAIFFIIKAKH